MRYDEFPDRNTYIYGFSFEGANRERIVDLNFVNYRCREDSKQLPDGHSIIGLQVNTKSHPDHISRLGFIIWGEGEHFRLSKRDKVNKAIRDNYKDLATNFVLASISFLPLIVAGYFVSRLNEYINLENNWLPGCEEE